MQRRSFLRSAAGLIGLSLTPSALRALGEDAPRVLVDGTPLKIPALWDGTAAFVTAMKNTEIWSGSQTSVIAMGASPAWMVVMEAGAQFNATFRNDLQEEFPIHWHGLSVPSSMDGHPMDAIKPGDSFTYSFPIKNRAGTYFYHSHAYLKTGKHVYNGMYGAFIIHDEEERALGLPSGEFDIPVVMQDVRRDEAGQLIYSPEHMDHMEGYMGNVMLTNGTPDAMLNVKRGTYRFRLLNASNARLYHLVIDVDHPFTIIASDGGLLEKPVTVTDLWMGPAERYDILVDFSSLPPGSTRSLRSVEYPAPPGHMGGAQPTYPQGRPFDILVFSVQEETAPVYQVPERLSAIERYRAEDAMRVRTFELAMDLTHDMKHTINGKLYDLERMDEEVPFNELEIWEIWNNDDSMTHAMHIHGTQVQILSRNGNTDIPAHERGWKDTMLVHPDERLRFMVKFSDYDGMFMMHCHNLEHEDDGMMINIMVSKTMDVKEAGQQRNVSASYVAAGDVILGTIPPSQHSTATSVMTSEGKTVVTTFVEAGQTDVRFDASSLAAGMYWVGTDRQRVPVAIVR